MQNKILKQLAEVEMELYYAKNKDPENKKIATAWQSVKKALEDYAKAIGLI